MSRQALPDAQWEHIAPLLLVLVKATDCGVAAKDNHRLLEGILLIARTGSPWRDQPSEYGHRHQVYVRYNRVP